MIDELRCSRSLALALGAISPTDVAEHRRLRDAGYYILVRDETMQPLFWMAMGKASRAIEITTRGSSQ